MAYTTLGLKPVSAKPGEQQKGVYGWWGNNATGGFVFASQLTPPGPMPPWEWFPLRSQALDYAEGGSPVVDDIPPGVELQKPPNVYSKPIDDKPPEPPTPYIPPNGGGSGTSPTYNYQRIGGEWRAFPTNAAAEGNRPGPYDSTPDYKWIALITGGWAWRLDPAKKAENILPPTPNLPPNLPEFDSETGTVTVPYPNLPVVLPPGVTSFGPAAESGTNPLLWAALGIGALILLG